MRPRPPHPIIQSASQWARSQVATHSPKLLSVWQRNQASLKGLSVFVFSQMKSGSDECSVWLPPYLESSNQVPVARVSGTNGFDGFYTFARAVFLSDLSRNCRSLVTFRCSPPDLFKLAKGLTRPPKMVRLLLHGLTPPRWANVRLNLLLMPLIALQRGIFSESLCCWSYVHVDLHC